MTRFQKATVGIICGLALASMTDRLRADYEVDVGYADNLRPSPFFPNPWSGAPNVAFAGDNGPAYDAGAVMVKNTGLASIAVQDITVDSFENGASFHVWGGFLPAVLAPGHAIIFTQTAGDTSFDTSDLPQHDLPGSTAKPVVHLTVDGVLKNWIDTAQVLNTEGSDHLALTNQNESHAWRPIGTFGGQAPEPSSLVLLGLGGLALGYYGWRKKMTRS